MPSGVPASGGGMEDEGRGIGDPIAEDTASSPEFPPEFRSRLDDLIAWRRDVRHFRPDRLPDGVLDRLFAAAAFAPSVGLSQPWRFVLAESEAVRTAVRACFARCNAEALAGYAGDRAALYATMKLAGLSEAPVQFAVFADLGTGQGHGLGRRTMPATLEYSAVMAIHTLWLVARAEGIGLGWVSIVDPSEMADLLAVPPTWKLIGYFCLGYPVALSATPELERVGWEHRRPPEILRR